MRFVALVLRVSLGLTALLLIIETISRGTTQSELDGLHVRKGISISNSLADLFVRFHSNGSIVVRGECSNGNFITDQVPTGPIEHFGKFQDALAEWSRVVPRLAIYHDSDGMWRVSDGTASADLLKVKISDLRVQVIDGEDAIGAVLDSKEVELFLRNSGIKEASTTAGLAPYHASKLPHSSWHLRDVTVAEAFDAAVEKYPGVWVYTECVGRGSQKLVNVRTLGF